MNANRTKAVAITALLIASFVLSACGPESVAKQISDACAEVGPGSTIPLNGGTVTCAGKPAPAPEGDASDGGAPAPTPAAADCTGVTVLTEAEEFQWLADTNFGDDRYNIFAVLAEGDRKVGLLVEDPKVLHVEGFSMSGRVWKLEGSLEGARCYGEAQLDAIGDPNVYKLIVLKDSDATAPAGWSTELPEDWVMWVETLQTEGEVITPEGVNWLPEQFITTSTGKIGGDAMWRRCELWSPALDSTSYDLLIQPDYAVAVTGFQGTCWPATGLNDENRNDFFRRAEQASGAHQAKDKIVNLYLVLVGDADLVPNELLLAQPEFNPVDDNWLHWDGNVPDGWDITTP